MNLRDQNNFEFEKIIHTLTSSVVHFHGNNNYCSRIHAMGKVCDVHLSILCDSGFHL